MYDQMQYKAAAKFSRSSPCTIVPIHCPICSTGFTPPKIPRQLLSHMNITREEEKVLWIKEEVTVAWREEHNIPDTESLLELIQTEEM